MRWPRAGRWFFVYFTWAGLSILWTTGSVRLTVWLWFLFGTQLVLIALTMSSSVDRKSVIESSLAGVVAGGWVASLELMEELRLGVDVKADAPEGYMHPNGLGFDAGLACLCALFLWSLNRRPVWMISIVILFGTLLLSDSKGSLASFFIFALPFLLSSRSRLTKRWKLRVASILAGITLVSLRYVGGSFQAYGATGNVETLTGRTLLWAMVYEKILVRPIIGYGYESFSYNWPQGAWYQGSAHNELLQEWFTLGAIGVGVLVLCYWGLLRALWRSRSTYSRFGIYLLGFSLIRGLVEADDAHIRLALLFACSLGVGTSRLRRGRRSIVRSSSAQKETLISEEDEPPKAFGGATP